MKLLTNSDLYRFLSGRMTILLAGVLMLNACATSQPENVTPPPLQHPGPPAQISDVNVLAVSPAMEQFLEHYVLKYSNKQTRLEMLTTAIVKSGVLGFEYDGERTMTASEAFAKRTGNCVAFSNMMIALARRSGLKAKYQEVYLRPVWSNFSEDTVLLYKHVNVVVESDTMSWVVDVSGLDIRPTDRRRIVNDSYAKALYLNNMAVDALLAEDLPTAYAYLNQAIKTNPGVTDPWVNLGVIFGRNEQLDDAAFAFKQALRIDRNEQSAWSNLYEVYIEQENFEAADALEPRVERYRRNNPYYLLRLSDEARELGQYEESISLLRKAIRKKDNDHHLHFAMAKTQYLSGDLAEAENSLMRARELAPESMIAYYERPLIELVSD